MYVASLLAREKASVHSYAVSLDAFEVAGPLGMFTDGSPLKSVKNIDGTPTFEILI